VHATKTLKAGNARGEPRDMVMSVLSFGTGILMYMLATNSSEGWQCQGRVEEIVDVWVIGLGREAAIVAKEGCYQG